MSRRIVLLCADTHAGHHLSLMNPTVKLPDKDETGEPTTWTPHCTSMQRWLWQCWTADIHAVRNLAGDDEIVVVHVGDITWGMTHPDRLVSGRQSDQPFIAAANMLPLAILDNVQVMRFIHGTSSHEFGHGSSSEIVSQYLKRQWPDKSIKAVQHSLLDVDGVLIDAAHHGPVTGSRSWLKGNVLRYSIRSQMMGDLLQGREPARVYVRAHYHEYTRELVRVPSDPVRESFGLILPAYCGLTHYAQKVTRSAYVIGCGMVALEIVDGRLAWEGVHAYHRTVDLRTKERL